MRHAHIVARLPHQQEWATAFADGLKRHGWNVSIAQGVKRCDLLVMWGVRNRAAIASQRRCGGEVCILERGYVGDRFKWTSVSFGGGLNGRGQFRGPMHDGGRWEAHFAPLMQPWRRRDGYALLIGQVPGDNSLAGVKIDRWYAATAKALRAAGWDVRFRPHPGAVARGHSTAVPDAPTLRGTLADALAGAGIVATYNSNAGVEAVLAGVPTTAADEGSMAWPVTGHAPGELVTPDRTPWAHWLAWTQYRTEEMRSGYCAEMVGLAARRAA